MLGGEPLRYRAVSFVNVWSLMKPPLGRDKPSTPYLGSAIMCPRTSVARMNK